MIGQEEHSRLIHELTPAVGESLAAPMADVIYAYNAYPDRQRFIKFDQVFARVAPLPEGEQTTALGLLTNHLAPYDVDVSEKWENHQRQQAEGAGQNRLAELADTYGSAAAFTRQPDNVLAQLADTQRTPRAIWGTGSEVLWAASEALMIEAGIRVGKTTLAGLLVRALIFGGNVLGYPVRKLEPGQRVLYLALDRPEQMKASLLRQLTAEQRAQLPEWLVIWEGPLPADAAEKPDVLWDVANHFKGIAVVILDSLKDAAVGLSDERVGQRYNEARQELLASGRQLVELHHLTKSGGDYGSTFLHAGAGSVLRLTGKVGGKSATLKHVLPVADVVGGDGGLKLALDHKHGEIEVKTPKAAKASPAEATGSDDDAGDLVAWVIDQGAEGVTKPEAALYLYGSTEAKYLKAAKRALDACPELRCVATSGGRGVQSRWFYLDDEEGDDE
jgi:hypothetical protein